MAVAERQSSLPALVPKRGERTLAPTLPRGLLALLRGVVYVLLTLIFLVPFIWMLFGSLRQETEIFRYLYPLNWHTFVPVDWTLNHYLDILGLSEEGKLY